jgi:type VI secretion system protein ImpE
MKTAELIQQGKLMDARQQLVQEVKSAPGDLGKRTTLSQVLCFCGEWEKAERQLDAIAVQDAKREPSVAVYKNIIQAERERHAVLTMKQQPAFLSKTPLYFETYWTALTALSEGKAEEAESLFEAIEAQRPQISGTINGTPFTGIADTDSFLSFFLETIVHERYIWLPFESIREILITPPKTLFDLLWIPGQITTVEGLALNCCLPVVYAGSFAHEDERIRMGRLTAWSKIGGYFIKAMGQRVLDAGGQDTAILDIREAVINPATV